MEYAMHKDTRAWCGAQGLGPDSPPEAWAQAGQRFAAGIIECRQTVAPRAKPTKPAPKPIPNDGLPQIEIGPDEGRVNDELAAALVRDTTLFQRAGQLVHVCYGATDTLNWLIRSQPGPRINPMPTAIVRDRASRVARFIEVKTDGKGERQEKVVPPPDHAIKAVAARGQWHGIPTIDGVIETPVLRADGSVLVEPGYDRLTGLVYVPSEEFASIPATPTADEVCAAGDLLLEVVADFPFDKPYHKSTWLAYVLTTFTRHAFDGCVPLFSIDANVRGAGKSLLADSAALIFTGRPMPRMTAPSDEEETRKRITALVVHAEPLVLLDNISDALGGASLDAALTATTWRDRVLGKTELIELPLRIVWAATGNNLVFRADTARRVAHIRLESALENPEERIGFRHPNLKSHIRQHRGKLVAAALTILRGYCAAGRPDQRLKSWGSFEAWSDLVRSAIVWTGLPDPGEGREEVRSGADLEAGAAKALLSWLKTYGQGLTATELLFKARPQTNEKLDQPGLREALLCLCPTRTGSDMPSSRSLGMVLHHLHGRVVAGLRLKRSERDHTAVWSATQATTDS